MSVFFLDQTRKAFELLGHAPFAGQNFLAQANFNPMHGIMHDPNPAMLNNAFYHPHDGCLYFGDITDDFKNTGTIVRYTPRSRDIVIHEFTHAVTDAICRLGRTRAHTESRAMSEGFSDYFACSFLDYPIMGDYFKDDAMGLRTCENPQPFPRGYAGEEHTVGEIWASFLWSLRQDPEIGPTIADVRALQSLDFLGPSRTIIQGFHALLQADRRLFPADASATPGRHEERIQALFTMRKP